MEFSMSPTKFIYFGILVLFLSLSSCSITSQVQFQTLEAPQIVLPADISRIAFVDRNLHFPSDSVNQFFKVSGRLRMDSVDYTSKMGFNCYEGFRENLSEYLQQDSIPFVRLQETKITDDIRKSALMEWSSVDSICKATESDILFVLENIQVYNEHEIEEGDLYWILTEVSYLGLWRIYDPMHQKIYDERFVVDSLFMETSDASFQKLVTEKLPSRKQILNDASYELGRNYVDLISPRWKDVSRNYFVSGDKRLSTALYFMNKNEFDTAINMWQSLTKEKDMKLAGRAAYNLAVVHEMKGDLKTARSWIRKAIYFYKKMKNRPSEYKEIEAYALLLNSRWSNGEKIKKFFGE